MLAKILILGGALGVATIGLGRLFERGCVAEVTVEAVEAHR